MGENQNLRTSFEYLDNIKTKRDDIKELADEGLKRRKKLKVIL